MCVTRVALLLVVWPSPKSQNVLVIVPLELLVKVTGKGQKPPVGPALKAATGTNAALPVIRLVELPPLLAKRTSLLKLPSATGPKLTITMLVCTPGTENEPLP